LSSNTSKQNQPAFPQLMLNFPVVFNESFRLH
jgi:hypothetical protein